MGEVGSKHESGDGNAAVKRKIWLPSCLTEFELYMCQVVQVPMSSVNLMIKLIAHHVQPQALRQRLTSRPSCRQHIHSRRLPSTSQSHERYTLHHFPRLWCPMHQCPSHESCSRLQNGAHTSWLSSPLHFRPGLQDVTLQNEGAWGALAAAKPAEAKDAAKPADGSAGAAGSGPGSSAPGEQDPLWSEFASREQQQRKREAEKAAEEEKRRAEKAKVGRGALRGNAWTQHVAKRGLHSNSPALHCRLDTGQHRMLARQGGGLPQSRPYCSKFRIKSSRLQM